MGSVHAARRDLSRSRASYGRYMCWFQGVRLETNLVRLGDKSLAQPFMPASTELGTLRLEPLRTVLINGHRTVRVQRHVLPVSLPY
jgi:hypothetical protein